MSKPPVLCIVGPTATGKSDVAIAVAKEIQGEIISADSMQVYRGMDIGTAKVMPEERQGVPHHLLDMVFPDERFTVADWATKADDVIQKIYQRGHVPIVVGGTGLYIRAMTEDLNFRGPDEASLVIRQKWELYAQEHGRVALHEALASRDPSSAARLHPNDVRRVIRALEVYDVEQRPLSAEYDWRVQGGRYQTVQFGLTAEREVLYRRVNLRVDAMIEAGLLREVERLVEAGYDARYPAMQAIGYKELLGVLEGSMTLNDAAEQIKQNTRRFVKRQLSWFRRDERVRWVDIGHLRTSMVSDTEQSAQSSSEGSTSNAVGFREIVAVGTQMLAGILAHHRE